MNNQPLKQSIPEHIQNDLDKIVFEFGMIVVLDHLRSYALEQAKKWYEQGGYTQEAKKQADTWMTVAKHLDI